MTAGEIINRVMDVTQKEANRYSYPVYISDIQQKPDLIATSVIIELGKKYYLITASHVLLGVLSKDSQFIIGANGKFVALEGAFIYSSHEKIDNFDIAYTELSPGFMESNSLCALAEEKLIINTRAFIPHIAFIHGYPNSMNKQNKALFRTKKFKIKAYAYGGAIKEDFEFWEECEKEKTIHTCMTYGMTSSNNTPRHPRGISGGGLWIVPKYSEPNNYFLDAILIEYHKNYDVTFSTKLSAVIIFIKNSQ